VAARGSAMICNKAVRGICHKEATILPENSIGAVSREISSPAIDKGEKTGYDKRIKHIDII
jgi:hypothetical protein